QGVFTSAKAARCAEPAEAVTTYPPGLRFAVSAGATAMPFRSVCTRTTRRLPKRAVGPCAGAANVTAPPATALPSASLTVTAGRIGKRVPTRVDSPDAEPAAIAAGLPARFRSVNLAELPPPVTAAVAAKLPALPFATTAGDVARPF